MEKTQAVEEIKGHIQRCGDKYSDWYVGIATEPRERLFNDHSVDRKNGAWIYRDCETSEDARKVEAFFINSLGTDGGSGGGDRTTTFVYAYKKTSHTSE